MTANPERRSTQAVQHVVNFRLACERNGKTGTDFLNCVAWDKRADSITQYFSKGDMILIRGRLQTRTYEKDDQRREVVEIVVDDYCFVGGNKRSESSEAPANPFKDIEVSDEELPF